MSHRQFQLAVCGGGGAPSLRLEETGWEAGPPVEVAAVPAGQSEWVRDSALAAIRASGQPTRGGLTVDRTIPLTEPAAVRLALIMRAVTSLTEPVVAAAATQLVGGINAMGVEETFYWYAKVALRQRCAARALAVLLGAER
jgi:hypothetical protein